MPIGLTVFHERLDAAEAALCRTIGVPLRIRILHQIAEGPDTPAGLAARLGVEERQVESALAALRHAGLIGPDGSYDGACRLHDPALGDALRTLRQVAYRNASRRAGPADRAPTPPSTARPSDDRAAPAG